MSNRLSGETSPYLLQHADNPVDWFPWGPEALARGRERDLPLLVSIGYSSCHWCHVMERESFEDADTAAYMNEHFVPIKVDREERPDIDAIYMEAVQSITGQGGWPLTAFCDPDGVPFHGGTYFPPEPASGMPSFMMVMEAVVDAYRTKREEIRGQAENVRTRLGAIAQVSPAPDAADAALLERSTEALLARADMELGGFGQAPKFPPASALEFLIARGELAPVELTLDAMAAGGIHDQLGGGFSRYSVDSRWLVPHFEKMLYDNALLARAYLHGWQALGHDRYRRVCEGVLDWALAEMRDQAGGFHSALDADSEGEEGRFYVWTAAEIRELLGEGAEPVIAHYGVTDGGNFEGANVLHLAGGFDREPPPGLDRARRILLEARSGRVRPGLDDKVICSWNALMIAALAEAGAVLERPDYLRAAAETAEFVWTRMRDAQGTLLRSFRAGEARLNAYLEDHAFLVEALLTLYGCSFDRTHFDRARAVAETMIDRFADPDRGGFFSTSHDHEALIARRKDVGDHPIPAGSSAAAFGLLRLSALTGERRYERQAAGAMQLLLPAVERNPDAFGHLLAALDFHLSPTRELALVAPPGSGDAAAALAPMSAVVHSRPRPHLVLAGGPEGAPGPELMRERTAVDGRPTAYLCESFACRAPITEPERLEEEIDGFDS